MLLLLVLNIDDLSNKEVFMRFDGSRRFNVGSGIFPEFLEARVLFCTTTLDTIIGESHLIRTYQRFSQF